MRPPPQGLWAGPPPGAGDLPGIPISRSERPCPWRPGSQRPRVSVSAETGGSVRWPQGPSLPGPLARSPKEEGSVSRKGSRMSQNWGVVLESSVTCRAPAHAWHPRGQDNTQFSWAVESTVRVSGIYRQHSLAFLTPSWSPQPIMYRRDHRGLMGVGVGG